jgi:PiT family inorganic phosphate transporter
MGLILLIVIGLLPAQFALDMSLGGRDIRAIDGAALQLDRLLAEDEGKVPGQDLPRLIQIRQALAEVHGLLDGKESFNELSAPTRWNVRASLLESDRGLGHLLEAMGGELSKARHREYAEVRTTLRKPVEYVPGWIAMGVALSLGIGTTVGWKRIVVTVAEKIGKGHLTYAQGACAETVAMATIGLADLGGMPVSTTHVLSSGVAGAMWANRSGLQAATLRKIAVAWILTLPAAMFLSAFLYTVARELWGR